MAYNSSHTGTQIDNAVDKVGGISVSSSDINTGINKINAITPSASQINAAVTKINAITPSAAQINAGVDKINAVSASAAQINDAVTKANRALLTPLSTPSEKTLVGIDTANAQIQVKIGNGLRMSGTTSPYTLQADTEAVAVHMHIIAIRIASLDTNITNVWMTLMIVTDKATPYSFDEFKSWLNSHGFTGSGGLVLGVNGTYIYGGTTLGVVRYVYHSTNALIIDGQHGVTTDTKIFLGTPDTYFDHVI